MNPNKQGFDVNGSKVPSGCDFKQCVFHGKAQLTSHKQKGTGREKLQWASLRQMKILAFILS